jgi:hypothetical protein
MQKLETRDKVDQLLSRVQQRAEATLDRQRCKQRGGSLRQCCKQRRGREWHWVKAGLRVLIVGRGEDRMGEQESLRQRCKQRGG